MYHHGVIIRKGLSPFHGSLLCKIVIELVHSINLKDLNMMISRRFRTARVCCNPNCILIKDNIFNGKIIR